ncbi:flavin reductase family protein [Halomarina oriensis]|uniref:Flavin reductase family protein n=1 Tax=Halomarina oriensis TaxID=671145 RepID=A0A6B0GT57_9EURY|nr:flavin reductase family protein [Halomarina oriensis]MWG35863.1 flavin reductase family protein [Halomarina oriensis]
MEGTPDEFGSGYRLLSSVVVPRPIAWVGSYDADGTANLAPYSFFNVVSAAPPVIYFAPGGTGEDRKDSANNAIESEAFTVHVVTREFAEAMNATSAALDPDEDEFEHAGLERVDATNVHAPRIADAPVVLECELYDTQEVGHQTLVFGEVVYAHVDDGVVTDGKPDVTKLDAVGRLAGNYYATTDDRFRLERP